ncbi:MAG: hypothetical protein J0L75_10445 [Spirochaetes bacterium]|nr:hypothetical protein [Spirochaetota bacterium]
MEKVQAPVKTAAKAAPRKSKPGIAEKAPAAAPPVPKERAPAALPPVAKTEKKGPPGEFDLDDL